MLPIIEKYQKLESEKKNTRTVRKTHVGPMIRYQSLSMPVMVLSETSTNDKDEKINVDCDDDKNTNAVSNGTSSEVMKDGRYSMDFLLFFLLQYYCVMHK